MQRDWDIFCKVIDNHGDLGVCWRLARQLAGLGERVRLWVDDASALAWMAPEGCAGVRVIDWSDPAAVSAAAAEPAPRVLIEAFGCDPAPALIARFAAASAADGAPRAWINLEYLSAEPYVERLHGLPSPVFREPGAGLTKRFFYPGFTPATGGLLRETGLSAERDAFQADRDAQEAFLRGLGVADSLLSLRRNGARTVSLFCYPSAPVDALARALAATPGATLLLVPEGVAPRLETACAVPGGPAVARLPFVAQPDFDRILWCADLNFVRGEDSFVRAAWAARPLAWQIYPQDENIHLEKLDAWLARYPAPEPAVDLIRAWNQEDAGAAAEAALVAALRPGPWQAWNQAARDWDAAQAARPDLAENLAGFCAELAKKR